MIWSRLSSRVSGCCRWLCQYQLFSNPGTNISKTYLLTSPNERTSQMKAPTRDEIGLRSCDITYWVISATRCSCYMRCVREWCTWMVHYFWIFTSRVSVFKLHGVVICAVPTADAVATGEGKKRKTRRQTWSTKYGRGDRGSREMRRTWSALKHLVTIWSHKTSA